MAKTLSRTGLTTHLPNAPGGHRRIVAGSLRPEPSQSAKRWHTQPRSRVRAAPMRVDLSP